MRGREVEGDNNMFTVQYNTYNDTRNILEGGCRR